MAVPKIALRELATIAQGPWIDDDRFGYIQPHPNGNTRAIQAQDFAEDGYLNIHRSILIQAATLSDPAFLRQGDLICCGRVHKTVTVLIDQLPMPTICVSPLLTLRILPEQSILPAYLFWFMNLPVSQHEISRLGKQKPLPMLSAARLGDFLVPVPPLHRQQKIAEIHRIARDVAATSLRLMEVRAQEADIIMLRYVKGLPLQKID